MSGKRWLLVATLLLLVGCGGDGGSDQAPSAPPTSSPSPTVPAPAPETEAGQVSRALASHGTLPPYLIPAPTLNNPMLDGAGVMLDERNNTYNPTLIARLALDRYTRWRTGKPSNGEDYIKTARTQADWLAKNIDCRGGVGVWHYQFPSFFGAEPGWVSGFGNAHAIVALFIMSRFIDDPERYIEPALCGIGAFDVDVAEGGVKTALESGGKWYEEYATAARPGVMNGHVFTLAGLYYACEYASIQRTCALFTQGVFALRSRLPKYDAGFTSRYSLDEASYASPGYNELHHGVLYWLHSVTGDPEFKRYADLFLDYEAEKAKAVASFTADLVEHGPELLTDGNIFFGYWSSHRLPTTIDLEAGGRVRALAVAFASDAAVPFQYAPVDANGVVGTYVDSPAPTLTRHSTAEFTTTVGVYQIGIDAQKIRLRFSTPLPQTEVIALREINVLH